MKAFMIYFAISTLWEADKKYVLSQSERPFGFKVHLHVISIQSKLLSV